jgi:hypothetical protein
MKRRDFLLGLVTVYATAAASGIHWSVVAKASSPDLDVDSNQETNLTVNRVEHRYKKYSSNIYSHFDPVKRLITVHYDLVAEDNSKNSWFGKVVAIPFDGPQGIYEIESDRGHNGYVVITKEPSKKLSGNLVLVPDITFAAYNNAGSGSLYKKQDWVSIDRPIEHLAKYGQPHYSVLKFLDQKNINYDLIRQSDIDFSPYKYDMSTYDNLIIYGHDEYWTPYLRSNIERAVASGTNLINLSGNTAFWGVSLQGRRINRSILGKLQYVAPTLSLLGNHFLYAGYPIARKLPSKDEDRKKLLEQLHALNFPLENISEYEAGLLQGVRVLNPSASVLRGISTKRGDWIHNRGGVGILGIEIDGIPLDSRGNVDLNITKGIEPKELEIATEGWGWYGKATHFGFNLKSRYKGGGWVYSNSSITWVQTLMEKNETTQKITLNAFENGG